jgi:hypothetical protein
VNTQLTSSAFSTRVIRILPTQVTSVNGIVTSANTRRPTLTPTQAPVGAPTKSPTKDKSNNSNAGPSILLIVLLSVVGGFICLAVCWRGFKIMQDISKKDSLSKEISMRQASIKRAKAYSNPDIYMKPSPNKSKGGAVQLSKKLSKKEGRFASPATHVTTEDSALSGKLLLHNSLIVIYLPPNFVFEKKKCF